MSNFLNFPIIPVGASTFAEKVDPLFYLLTLMSTVLTVGIFMGIVIMAAVFRKKPGVDRPSQALHAPILELTWTIIPTIVGLGLFVWGAVLFDDYIKVPEGALQIDVIAKQWMWKVQHENGMREVNDLHIPVGRPVKLTMMSQDVLHNYAVPAMRVKQDVIPGRYTSLWFEPTKTGAFPMFCSEYCGTEHSLMGGTVYVMEPQAYNEWLAGGPKVSPQEAGRFLFEEKLGCVTCHTGVSGARGPDLKEVFGHAVKLADGSSVTADEEYLRESIMEPAKRIVATFTPLMPNFANQLNDEDVANLIAYIKSLTEEEVVEVETGAPAP